MRISARSRLYAVVGDPVAHSLSPAIHNAAIAALGIEAVYVALRVPSRALDWVIRGIIASGGGVNVTVPHKRAVVPLLDAASDSVGRTGACNTVWAEAAGPMGDNTDVEGVRAAARALLDGRAARRATILGTGGSARAVAVALTEEWPGVEVDVVSRDAERREEFVTWAAGAGVSCQAVEDGKGNGETDLLVNATPLGLMEHDPLPIERRALVRVQPFAVLDLAYAPGETRLARLARELGAQAVDGRGVLVEQGAAAFHRFFHVEPPTEVMRAAVEDALRP